MLKDRTEMQTFIKGDAVYVCNKENSIIGKQTITNVHKRYVQTDCSRMWTYDGCWFDGEKSWPSPKIQLATPRTSPLPPPLPKNSNQVPQPTIATAHNSSEENESYSKKLGELWGESSRKMKTYSTWLWGFWFGAGLFPYFYIKDELFKNRLTLAVTALALGIYWVLQKNSEREIKKEMKILFPERS